LFSIKLAKAIETKIHYTIENKLLIALPFLDGVQVQSTTNNDSTIFAEG
jgi:hypothetical protein